MGSNFHGDCVHVLSGMLRHHHSSESWESKPVSVLPLAMKFSAFMLVASFMLVAPFIQTATATA